MPSEPARCDGCGHASETCWTFRQEDEVLGTYCYGCRDYLQRKDIAPGDHEQYQLLGGTA